MPHASSQDKAVQLHSCQPSFSFSHSRRWTRPISMIYRCPFQLLCIFCTNRAVMQQLQTLIDYMPRSQYGLLKTHHMSHFELQAHYCIHCIVQHSLGGPLVQGICNTKVHHGVIKQSANGWACTSFDSTTLSLEVRSSDMQRVDPAHVQHLAFFEYVICNTW